MALEERLSIMVTTGEFGCYGCCARLAAEDRARVRLFYKTRAANEVTLQFNTGYQLEVASV
jgi:hypothetical protein